MSKKLDKMLVKQWIGKSEKDLRSMKKGDLNDYQEKYLQALDRIAEDRYEKESRTPGIIGKAGLCLFVAKDKVIDMFASTGENISSAIERKYKERAISNEVEKEATKATLAVYLKRGTITKEEYEEEIAALDEE